MTRPWAKHFARVVMHLIAGGWACYYWDVPSTVCSLTRDSNCEKHRRISSLPHLTAFGRSTTGNQTPLVHHVLWPLPVSASRNTAPLSHFAPATWTFSVLEHEACFHLRLWHLQLHLPASFLLPIFSSLFLLARAAFPDPSV